MKRYYSSILKKNNLTIKDFLQHEGTYYPNIAKSLTNFYEIENPLAPGDIVGQMNATLLVRLMLTYCSLSTVSSTTFAANWHYGFSGEGMNDDDTPNFTRNDTNVIDIKNSMHLYCIPVNQCPLVGTNYVNLDKIYNYVEKKYITPVGVSSFWIIVCLILCTISTAIYLKYDIQ